MNYKQKYEQALENLKKIKAANKGNKPLVDFIEYEYPELKESEDEKIRKDIIGYLQYSMAFDKSFLDKKYNWSQKDCSKWIDWLEKQGKVKHTCRNCQTFQDLHQNCPYSPIYQYTDLTDAHKHLDDETHCEFWLEKQVEQKLTDKVEPKFKVGDYIINEHGFIMKIDGIYGNMYIYHVLDDDSKKLTYDITKTDKSCHIWTFRDAKPGDVLYLKHEGVEHVIIYKGLVKKNFETILSAYCAYNGFVYDFCFADVSSYASITSERDEKDIYPATKEQRDLLFYKMKEAGYEWDAENKELKKIEQTPISIVDDWIEDYWKHYKVNNPDSYDKGEEIQFDHDGFVRFCQTHCPKPAWSEEDEYVFMNTYELVKENEINPNKSSCAKECLIWLKSLRERIIDVI